MTTKQYVEDGVYISEQYDDNAIMIAVSAPHTLTDPVDVNTAFFVYDKPSLHGEDYPVLVQVWDNKEDDIYDTL